MDFRVLVSFEGLTVWKKRDKFCLGGGMNFGYFFGQIFELVLLKLQRSSSLSSSTLRKV